MLLTAPLLKIVLDCNGDAVHERHSFGIYK